jgi:hypothetical protein
MKQWMDWRVGWVVAFLVWIAAPVRAVETDPFAPIAFGRDVEPTDSPARWSFDVLTYAWVPGMEGTVSRAGRTANVSESVADAFEAASEYLKLGFTAHIDARRDCLVVFGDLMYLALEDTDINSRVIGPGEVEFSMAIGEIGVAYSIVDEPLGQTGTRRFRVDPLVGVRGYYLSLDLEFPFAGVDVSGERFWVDGFAGLRSSIDVTDRLTLFARADLGAGGSDLSWNVLVGGKLRVFDHGAIYAGYRWLDIDYQDGGTDFEFDVRLAGPFLGIGLTF